ncbi:MAG: hypothetical protein RLZZ447_1586, partial [Verrucomicrobiota bacterium]
MGAGPPSAFCFPERSGLAGAAEGELTASSLGSGAGRN